MRFIQSMRACNTSIVMLLADFPCLELSRKCIPEALCSASSKTYKKRRVAKYAKVDRYKDSSTICKFVTTLPEFMLGYQVAHKRTRTKWHLYFS